MNNKQILIVEDDNWLCDGLVNFLQQSNFKVLAANDLLSARAIVKQAAVTALDIVVCDIGLPDGSGLSLLDELRHSDTGTILISASNSEQARIDGLQAGADDYICKPINPDELLLRIKALLRRIRPQVEPSSDLCFLNYRLNLESRQLHQHQHRCVLSINEHQLLLILIAHKGKTVTRETIANSLDINSHYTQGRALDILVSRLRNKMQFNENSPSAIITHRGKGYMLIDRF
ncbi:response regulator transcription factor [Rheinheimera salexigens]|uniref:DNA-binding response regulator n=1 Tax=Rheinheimera salexigens TaxID=1628148 RepID=A0A1E7Q7R8_9GAMM|nr:response regulator transcription factor [Rheinheimera salexigens]OEY70123.1 hypothetical protein BI198_11525 [Rheinheimera salexigens]